MDPQDPGDIEDGGKPRVKYEFNIRNVEMSREFLQSIFDQNPLKLRDNYAVTLRDYANTQW